MAGFSHFCCEGFLLYSKYNWVKGLAETGLPNWVTHCTHPKCQQAPTHYASYRYVTGRRGRVTTRDLFLCFTHASQFAAKNGLTIHSAKDVEQALAAAKNPAKGGC